MSKIFIMILLTLGLFAGDFKQAVEDYNGGNYIKALNTFYELAKANDAKAQYNVGLIYANGKGVKKDLSKAQRWYEKSAKQGNGLAQYNLAQMYHMEGAKDAHSYAKAKHWYEKAIKSGIKEAYNNLGRLFLEGRGVSKDEDKAFELFKKGAELGDALSQINVAKLYAWGKDVSHDKLKAYESLKEALKNGKSEAGDYLDKLCQESTWVCKD